MTTGLRMKLLALTLILPAVALAQRVSEEYGYDRRGNDYTSFAARSLEECKRACSRDDRCQAYTYITSRRECWLKDRVPVAQRSRDAVTGVKQGGGSSGAPGRGLTEERGMDRRGNDYTSFRARGLSECQSACRREERCRAYTFDTRNGGCFLKDRVNAGQRNGVMITGYKTQDGGGRPPGGGWGRLTEERGMDRRGNDYDSFRTRNLEECKRECREDGRCQAYTYIHSSRTCYLKDRINSAQRNRDAVTGYRERN